MSAQPEQPAPDLPTPSPASSDADLSAWCDAATSGQLPAPSLARWQALRAGVVNLWEFDTAEYWFAGGRAQFIGQNQSGKSTLMALTTLIMLAGDLDRQYVDTFGERHKSFRYYVEPTDDATDRRSADGNSLNRGWAWVEYGRMHGDTPEFFTTLLYTQARRGAKDYVKQWCTSHGTTRVGRELLLTTGAQSRQPGELSTLPGFKIADSGTDYKQRISANLFGFDDTDRLDAVVKMLKVLRTPHLGRKLDPAFFTAQMREALPAVAKSEIDELAEGWDQLDRLANDRDSAVAAQRAVQAFLRKAWNPWADSVLRRHADDLAATVTRFDDVTKNIRKASETKQLATGAKDSLDTKVTAASDELGRTEQTFDNLRESQAYQDAHQATAHVQTLKSAAAASREAADTAASRARVAKERAERATRQLKQVEEELGKAETAHGAATATVIERTRAAGLPEDSAQWAGTADIARLSQSLTQRRAHVGVATRLLGALGKAMSEQNTASRLSQEAQGALNVRRAEMETAETARDTAAQALSDGLESWAAAQPDGPTHQLRTTWLDAVLAELDSERPRAVLTAQISIDWLDPRTSVLRDQAREATRQARERGQNAEQIDATITKLLAEQDPQPDGPLRWARRDRPASSPDGAPLWLLLDPADDLDASVLAGIESGLDATGLLDAWVSPDGRYLLARDGHDLAVDLTEPAVSDNTSKVGTLAGVLCPAQDAGPLTGPVAALLRAVSYAGPGTALNTQAAVALSGDGRWATQVTAGTAGPGPHGAELLGTAARALARDRRVHELKGEAELLRAEATALLTEAEQADARIQDLTAQAAAAPNDETVVDTARTYRHAHHELAKADVLSEQRKGELVEAEIKSADASSRLIEHTGAHSLPPNEAGLSGVATALESAKEAVHSLRLTLEKVTSANALVVREREAVAGNQQDADDLDGQTKEAATAADTAQDAADNAEEALGQDEKEILEALEKLRARKVALKKRLGELNEACLEQAAAVATAAEKLTNAEADRDLADKQRAAALVAWWQPVDAGLAAHRGLPAVPDPGERLLTHALAQSRAARELLTPPNWPSGGPGATTADKEQRVNTAFTRMTGPALIELRTVLESSGGRSASVLDPEETGLLPAVIVLVDSSGAQVDPVEAVARLTEQADNLARLHDEKMQSVLVELLSSTFVEHLRERLGQVVALIANVNKVLAAHPTGANNTKLRLKRIAAEGQKDAFGVLDALENRFIDDPEVQEQVRAFLEKQIREAQDLGRAGDAEWKEHLAGLLDYRQWFNVVTEFQVMDSTKWTALTAEFHAKDSGGGKVVTLLQPLLATLVALYDESDTAPRPLWLDEAFSGVDDSNRSTMLDLLVEFDLDFLLAGPGAVVATAHVPSAAAWFVTRAPAPDAGVDLSLMLWAGRTMSLVPLPARGLGSAAANPPVVVDAHRLSLFDVEPP